MKQKSAAGRPGKIDSKFPLKRVSARISIEAIEKLSQVENKSLFIDQAIKEKEL